MFNFIKKIFKKKKNNVLIDISSIDKSMSVSMTGNGDCSDFC